VRRHLFKAALLQFSVWLAASGAIITFVVLRWHYGQQFETNILHHQALAAVDRLWFYGTDHVFAARRTPQGLTVTDITATQGAAREPVLISRRSDTAYAVSPEGDTLVTATGRAVTLVPILGGQAIKGKSSLQSEIKRVAWIDGAVVLALHANGELEAINANNLQQRATIDSELMDPSALAANGTFVAVGSADRRTIRVFDTRMLPQISVVETEQINDPFVALNITAAGAVVRGDGKNELAGVAPIPGIGRIHLIDFLNGDGFLIADSTKLRFVSSRLGQFEVPNVPAGITALAANESQMAVASAAAVVLLHHRITPPVDNAGWSIVWRWFAATAMVGMFCFVRAVCLRAAVREHNTRSSLARAARSN
jgi:hypothetical protein